MSTGRPAATPEPPYYAAIFTSRRAEGDNGYCKMSDAMVRLASQQPGFLGYESARGSDGLGITVSYWTSEEAIRNWKMNSAHLVAQQRGKEEWYEDFIVRVARVERSYGGPPPR